MKKWLFLVLLVCTASARADLPEITLTMGSARLIVEVAASEPEREKGLMYRRMLPENRGMLFVFPETARHGMWMMNTYVPLSVAFIDEHGVIVNIEDMQPQTQDNHVATRPVRYAVEANLGWFRKNGIKPGARVEGLQLAPPPR